MAEIKVAIKGDDSDIKAKFKEVSEEARSFANHVKEQFGGLKDAAADIAGESGFGAIKKVLTGLGGVAFGAAIVDGFKEAATAAIDFEKVVSSLSSTLGPALGGQAESLAKWVQSVSGAMGSFEENMRVFQGLLREKIPVEKAESMLINIQNAAKSLGVSVSDLGDKFIEAIGEGKVPERFFKEFPALGPLARALGNVPAPGAAPIGAEKAPETPLPTVDFLVNTLLPRIAPGGLQSPVRMAAQATTAGQIEDIGASFHQLSEALGTELLPVIREFIGDLKAGMPELGKTLRIFGEDLRQALGWIHSHLGWLGADVAANRYPGQRTIEALHEGFFSTAPPDPAMHAKLFQESAVALHSGANRIDASAAKIERALTPKR